MQTAMDVIDAVEAGFTDADNNGQVDCTGFDVRRN